LYLASDVCEAAQKHTQGDDVVIPDGSATFKMKGREWMSSRPAEDMGVFAISIVAIANNLRVGLLIQHSVLIFERTFHKMQMMIVF
jgi:hypothetical protein